MPLLEMASRDRRLLLAQLVEVGDRWALSASYDLPGAEVLEAARAAGLEGVVAKRAGSPYLPGRRSADWVKVKLLATQEVVIGGWTEGKGSRAGRFGALLVGVPGPEGPARAGLHYAGKVGTGFSEESGEELLRPDKAPDEVVREP